MIDGPVDDVGAVPDPASSERGERRGEVLVRLDELVHALAGHAEHLGDLVHADELEFHILEVTLDA